MQREAICASRVQRYRYQDRVSLHRVLYKIMQQTLSNLAPGGLEQVYPKSVSSQLLGKSASG